LVKSGYLWFDKASPAELPGNQPAEKDEKEVSWVE
jgi:hypothetical protein